MRRELCWALSATAVLAIGVTCAEAYARLAAPYYAAVDRLIAQGHPWTIISVDVKPGTKSPSAELQLVGEVRRNSGDTVAQAKIISHVQVGEAVEAPIVFWTLLFLWPVQSRRQRLLYVLAGVPIFLGLEAITTGIQLMHAMAEASAILAGEQDPMTLWERWSRFLEAGGRFVVEVCAALLTVAIGSRGSFKSATTAAATI